MVVGRGCRGEGQRLPQFQFEAIPKFWSRAASKVEQWECASCCKPVLLRRRKPVNFTAGPCADGFPSTCFWFPPTHRKREPPLKNCFHQVGLRANQWGRFLTDVGGPSHPWASDPGLYTKANCSRLSVKLALHDLCFSSRLQVPGSRSCPDLRQQWEVMPVEEHMNKPYI